MFYEHLQTVAETARSAELQLDSGRGANALQEVLVGLASDTCRWLTGGENGSSQESHSEGSGREMNESRIVDCSNVTDIERFARLRTAEIILREFGTTVVSTEVMSLALHIRSTVVAMLRYLRSNDIDLVPGSIAERQAWVARNLSPRNRCFVCGSL